MSIITTEFFSEFSTLFLKIVKAQLAGRGAQIIVGGLIAVGIMTIAYLDVIFRVSCCYSTPASHMASKPDHWSSGWCSTGSALRSTYSP